MGFFVHLQILSLAVLGVRGQRPLSSDGLQQGNVLEGILSSPTVRHPDGLQQGNVLEGILSSPMVRHPDGLQQGNVLEGILSSPTVRHPDCNSKCKNGATCNSNLQCDCAPGWEGESCDIEATIFVGPYDHGWSHDQCKMLGHHNEKNLTECKLLCTHTQSCTALGVLDNSSACVLVSCPWPVPLPHKKYTWNDQAYAIAEVCDTESKCGIRGGFCITGKETCNGKVITEEGYCNANYENQINQMGCKCCLNSTMVYMRDIENTIAYALRNRAPYNFTGPPPANGSVYRTLNTTQQETLSNFSKALVHHLPLRPSLVSFLNCLSGNLSTSNGKSIKGQYLLHDIYRGCRSDTDLPYVREWVNCKNFDSPGLQSFRSYPCGVWTTFHAMTVNLTDGDQQKVPRILPTLYGMVAYFPWCHMCQHHFMNRYKNQNAENITTADNVTMWLWRTHNEVNVNETTIFEPNRPKSVFPDFKLCPDCWELFNKEKPFQFTPTMNEIEVLSYLRNHYKWNAIVQDTQDELEAEVTINA